MTRRLLLLLGLVLVAAPSFADESKVEEYVKAEMARRHVPGLSVAVVRDGQVVLSRGFGMANLEHSVPARPDTVYQLASVTKQFTAAGIMLLVEDGKVGLDEAISKYLPDLPEAWSAVTVRHLLTHTSGIKSYTSLPDFVKTARKDYTKEELLALVRDLPPDFQPGEKWAYNNTGYYLLGMIIERVSGKSYGEFLEERIFKPLGMTSTRLNDLQAVIRNRATGYTWRGRHLNGEYVSPTQPYAAGALVSTVEDLVKWDAALDSGRVLKKPSLEESWAPVKLNDGKTHPYGFGWGLEEHNGHPNVSHGGGIQGFSTHISRYPTDRLTVIVLANSDTAHAGTLARGIAAVYVPDLAEKPTAPADDTEPKITQSHRELVESLAAGTADPNRFTEDARKALFPERVKEARAIFGMLGPLKSFTLLSRQSQSEIRTHRYRAVFGETSVTFTFAETKDGKIAGAGIRPE